MNREIELSRPLKEHYEMETDRETTYRIFDYANDLENYIDYLEKKLANLLLIQKETENVCLYK